MGTVSILSTRTAPDLDVRLRDLADGMQERYVVRYAVDALLRQAMRLGGDGDAIQRAADEIKQRRDRYSVDLRG